MIGTIRQSFIRFWQWRKRRKAERKRRYQQMTFPQKVVAWVRSLAGAFVVVVILNGLAIAAFEVPTGSMENTVLAGENLFVNKFIFGPSTPQIIPLFNIPLPYYKLPPFRDPRRGEVIVFIYPGDRDEVKPKEFMYYLKRCIAVAGDTLLIRHDSVFVNGELMPFPKHAKFLPTVDDPTRIFPPGKGWTRSDYGPIRIPKKGDIIHLDASNFLEWEIFIKREGHEAQLRMGTVYIDGKPATSYTVERDYVFGMGDNRNNSLDSRYWGFIPKDNVVGTPMFVYWSWEKTDLNGNPLPLLKRLARIRWSRIGTIVY
ncbi:MAG: signal peptidase I [Bacteroidota bacterium]|nr:signal peptidase I [Candidatus Kapabacteria bacterium]MCS7301969.1 signal peptidase I [Candidatus Kapabacteria bacterium]MDW8074768.1 signal peptidase I [Bacteroidota bacterium]MDW8271407.1 signal peptidase I [Bacteroidota bacterium]